MCHPEFQDIHLQQSIPFTKCALQGGIENTFEWNAVMHLVLDYVVPVWHESSFGVRLTGKLYTHVVWAGNAWLLAANPEQLTLMITCFTAVLREHGLELKIDCLMYMDSV